MILTSIISFLLKINLSNIFGEFFINDYLLNHNIQTKGGGVVNDLVTYWKYILLLKEDFFNLFNLTLGEDGVLFLNFPLHPLIFSQIGYLESIDSYLKSIFIISLFFPIIVYFTLSKRFKDLDKSILFLLSSLIYIFPVFQFTSIWGNNHITALIFFCSGIFFLNSFINTNFNKITYLIISIIFFALACYTRQTYVFFFVYLISYIYKKINFKNLLYILFFIFICSLPGFYFLFKNPLLFLVINQDITNFNSAILVSGSIILFYLIPFIIQSILNNTGNLKKKISDLLDKKKLFISFLITAICVFNFEYNSYAGGGIFLKISGYLFNNQFLVFPTAFIGIYFLLYFCENNLPKIILAILLLVTYSSGFFIFQKYFEPMFYIIFLNFFDKDKIIISIKKNNFIIIFYFCIYYVFTNYMYFLGL